jgi:hypothetical protein
MTMLGRRELTNVVRLRYSRANRTQKSKILDQFVANTGYCRKYAIGLLGQPPRAPAPKRRRTQRRLYSSSLLDALVPMWETCECICSKLLRASYPTCQTVCIASAT